MTDVLPPANYLDRRVHAPMDCVYSRRSWASITGIVLHQTACRLSERPERWDTLRAHVGVTAGGRIMHVHEFTDVVAHANGFNRKCIGVEVGGLFAGIEGDGRTVWDNPETAAHEVADVLTETQADAARVAIRWIVSTVAANGGKVGVLVAHRQSSGTRRNDPGSVLWQRVAMQMHQGLGLSDGGPGFAIGEGTPIPEAWDLSRKGVKY